MKCDKCGAEYQLVERYAATVSIETVKQRLGADADKLEYSTGNGIVMAKPKFWLQEEWGRINDMIKELGGRWVSDGQNSRWEI